MDSETQAAYRMPLLRGEVKSRDANGGKVMN
jgi:hypothetical protein